MVHGDPQQRSARLAEVTAILKRGRIVHITGAGHNVRRENKEQTIEVLDSFLGRVKEGPSGGF